MLKAQKLNMDRKSVVSVWLSVADCATASSFLTFASRIQEACKEKGPEEEVTIQLTVGEVFFLTSISKSILNQISIVGE
jgi:hypothetical protein